jgi:hypothetical protein
MNNNNLRWLAVAGILKGVLRYLGVGLFLAGLTCMPFPVTNPKAVTSVFPWVAMTGSLVRYGAAAMGVGAVFFALSFAFRTRD